MVLEIIFIVVLLLFAIILHEYAHGWTALKLGDPTAKLAGRLSLNPIKHVDPIGTIVIPGVLMTMRALGYDVYAFGWAKPVPVNFLQLKNPKRDMIWVALAGPVTNIVLALFLSFLLRFLNLPKAGYEVLAVGIIINLLLAVFNMIPIPPLDGSRILMGLLPMKYARPYSRLEPFGIIIIVGLLYLGALAHVILPVISYLAKFFGVEI